MLVLGLIVPITMGLLLKRFCPKGAALLKRLLKPLSLFFILFVMIFGTYAYWFIFQFFTWRVSNRQLFIGETHYNRLVHIICDLCKYNILLYVFHLDFIISTESDCKFSL